MVTLRRLCATACAAGAAEKSMAKLSNRVTDFCTGDSSVRGMRELSFFGHQVFGSKDPVSYALLAFIVGVFFAVGTTVFCYASYHWAFGFYIAILSFYFLAEFLISAHFEPSNLSTNCIVLSFFERGLTCSQLFLSTTALHTLRPTQLVSLSTLCHRARFRVSVAL